MQVKFLCLNLWQGGNLFDEIVAFIKEHDPDIVALQEVYNGQNASLERKYRSVQALQEELGYPHESYAAAFLENILGAQIEQGNLVLSKFPILESNTSFYDVPFGERPKDELPYFEYTPRNLQHVRIDVHESKINLFNTQGVWGTDGDDNDRRVQMAQTIVNSIGDKTNVILCGDFNVQEKTKTIELIEKRLINVFKGELTTSFNMQQKTNLNLATAVVDMVFTSPNIKIISKSCPQANISDHLPLLVTFEI